MRSVAKDAVQSAAVVSCLACAVGAGSAYGQPFADRDKASVGYSAAELEPAKACEALARPSAEVVQMTATTVAAGDSAPAFCRVTGVIAPEIAFEVALPAQWNGRFFMIGNGGHAGEALDNPGRVAQRDEALGVG